MKYTNSLNSSPCEIEELPIPFDFASHLLISVIMFITFTPEYLLIPDKYSLASHGDFSPRKDATPLSVLSGE